MKLVRARTLSPVFLMTLSRTRVWIGSNQVRLTTSALLAPIGAVLLQAARSAVSLDLAGEATGTRYSGGGPKTRRERHCILRSRR